MLLNYLKLSFRLMSRNPFFTLINLLGLSTGFAVSCNDTPDHHDANYRIHTLESSEWQSGRSAKT